MWTQSIKRETRKKTKGPWIRKSSGDKLINTRLLSSTSKMQASRDCGGSPIEIESPKRLRKPVDWENQCPNFNPQSQERHSIRRQDDESRRQEHNNLPRTQRNYVWRTVEDHITIFVEYPILVQSSKNIWSWSNHRHSKEVFPMIAKWWRSSIVHNKISPHQKVRPYNLNVSTFQQNRPIQIKYTQPFFFDYNKNFKFPRTLNVAPQEDPIFSSLTFGVSFISQRPLVCVYIK